MRNFITLISAVLTAVGSLCTAEIIPSWSASVAVPGEQVVLYLTEANCGQNVFFIDARPKVENASVRVGEARTVPDPMDPNREPAEVQPIILRPDRAGVIRVEDIEVRRNDGTREKVRIPELPVLPTSEIKWYSDPIPYGALWYVATKDGYVGQSVRLGLKMFIPGGCDLPMPPQLEAVGIKPGNFGYAVQGVNATMQAHLMQQTTAHAKGQNWITCDFVGEVTPYREGRADIVGEIAMRQRQGIFTVAQSMLVLPTVTLSTLPLPPGAPAGFSGLVGQYSISASTTATELSMNEAVEVQITVRGTGNMQITECPAPKDSADWKLIPATRKPILNILGETTGIVFTQLIRPTEETAAVPAFSFSYFDPVEQQYKTVATAPIPLPWKETDTAGSGLRTTAAEPPPAGEIPVAEMTDIYGCIAPEDAPIAVNLPRWLWYLLYLPAVIILLTAAVRVWRVRRARTAGRRAAERALTEISRIDNGVEFLKAIGGFIESNIPADAAAELSDIPARRDEQAFRPDAAADLNTEEKAAILRRVRRVLSKTALLLMVALFTFGLQSSARAEEAAVSAVDAYRAGQYSKALQAFTENADGTDEAVRQYNIGNCLYRLGNPGAAAAAYARALLTDPYLAEARANLTFIQRKEGAILPPDDGVDGVFTFLSYGQLWCITIGSTALLALCAALYIIRRRGAWLNITTVFSGVVSLLCAVNLTYYLGQQQPHLTAVPAADTAYILRETTARTTADDAGSSICRLTPSTPVRCLAQRGTRSYIETAAGVRGWVPTADIEALTPGKPSSAPVILRF